MNRIPLIARSTSTLLVALGIVTAQPAAAQSAPPRQDVWAFRATVYGWFPGLTGTTEFPSGAGGPSIDVNADTLIESLKMAFMGTFEAQYGRWGGLIDWFYSDVGGDKAGTRDFVIHGQPLAAGVNANLSLDVKTNIVTVAGTYALVEKPEYSTVGGALAGNEIQKKHDQPVPGQQIIVRTTNGVLVAVTQPVNGGLRVGQRVYIEGNGDGARVVPQ